MIRVLMPVTAFLLCSAAPAEELDIPRPANSELKAMYEADQAARKAAKIDWDKLDAADEIRRKRGRELLDAGALTAADDYFHAAFIFQHGSEPKDFLLAHVLAGAAVKLGRGDASWIAATTLDRYLQAIGQPQVLGTQYRCREGRPWMEPYDPNLIPDSTRAVVDVPVRSEQVKHGLTLCGHAPGSATSK